MATHSRSQTIDKNGITSSQLPQVATQITSFTGKLLKIQKLIHIAGHISHSVKLLTV